MALQDVGGHSEFFNEQKNRLRHRKKLQRALARRWLHTQIRDLGKFDERPKGFSCGARMLLLAAYSILIVYIKEEKVRERGHLSSLESRICRDVP